MDGMRLGIGLVARLVFWVAALLIVGNAAAYLWSDGAILYSILSVALFPLTLFLWPWFSPEAASGWPFDDSVYLIYLFLVCLVAYPLSTIVGGMRPVG